jgi:hypothetical protein
MSQTETEAAVKGCWDLEYTEKIFGAWKKEAIPGMMTFVHRSIFLWLHGIVSARRFS